MRRLLLSVLVLLAADTARAETPAQIDVRMRRIMARAFPGGELDYIIKHMNATLMTNGESIDNETNDVFTFTGSETITLTYTTNVATFDSSTSATFKFTPALAVTGDLTLSGGASGLTFSGTASSIVVDDNDTTALVIGSTGLLNLITIDTGDNTETVLITGTTAVKAFDVGTGTASFAEAATFAAGAGAVTFSNTAGSISVPDNDTTALLIGSTGQLNLLTIDSGDDTETVIVTGTTATDALHVDIGNTQLDEALAVTGDVTISGAAGALTFGAASSSVVTTDNSATGLDIGSTGLTNAIRVVTTDDAEYVQFQGVAGASTAIVGANVTLDASDCGKWHTISAAFDSFLITLPALTAVPTGCVLTFHYIGANGGALVDITPNAVDGIEGGCTLAASVVTFSGTDDADVGLTKATILKGDTITITDIGDADDWYASRIQGICANN